VGLGLVAVLAGQSARERRQTFRFAGRGVVVTEPELVDDGFYVKGPASVCLEGPPRRQCYTAPGDYGRAPRAEVVWVDKSTERLLFTAASGGVSGFLVHFALLQPGAGAGAELEDFALKISLSEQGKHRFVTYPSLSNAMVLLTADYVWGMDEAHHGAHRYIISAYLWRQSSETGDFRYVLSDQYMTLRKYDEGQGNRFFGAEEAEIVARLKRVVAAELR
jgi:hypothetical protein